MARTKNGNGAVLDQPVAPAADPVSEHHKRFKAATEKVQTASKAHADAAKAHADAEAEYEKECEEMLKALFAGMPGLDS
jgi:hypothetical protein